MTSTDRLVAIGIVVSVEIAEQDLARTIATIKRARDAPLLLGGTGIRDADQARRLGADAFSNRARTAVDWIDATASRSAKAGHRGNQRGTESSVSAAFVPNGRPESTIDRF